MSLYRAIERASNRNRRVLKEKSRAQEVGKTSKRGRKVIIDLELG
jgi:hypothetical protein